MKNESQEVNKYPSREKFLTNFAIITWLKERYNKVIAEGDPKRIARYKGIAATKAMVEEPEIFNRNEGYFRSTIIARENGLLFPDPEIILPTFDEFLHHIDENKTLYDKDTIPNPLTFEELITLATSSNGAFPDDNEYALTKIDNTEKYALLVYSQSLFLDLDEIFDTVFNGYMFQNLKGYSLTESDDNYPVISQSTFDGYVTGSIDVTDVLLKEESITIDIFNLNLINKLNNVIPVTCLYDGSYRYNGQINYGGTVVSA